MREEILKIAVLYPHMYPWNHHLKNYSREDIDNTLKVLDIQRDTVRRKIGWLIDSIIYEEAMESTSSEELIERVGEKFSKLSGDTKILSSTVIHPLAQRKDLIKDYDLALYKSTISQGKIVFNNRVDLKKQELWIIDLYSLNFITMKGNHELSYEKIRDYVYETLKEILKYTEKDKDIIDKRLSVLGFRSRKNILDYREYQKGRSGVLKKLLKRYLKGEEKEKEKEKEDELFDDLLSMIEEVEIKEVIEDTKDEEESLTSKEILVGEINKAVDKFLQEASEKGKGISNEDIGLIGKLVNPNEGAVLSQLYEVYRNFEKVDRENVHAVLTDFFNCLMVNGICVAEEEHKVGEKFIAYSDKLLKKYRTTKPVDKESFLAEVKYAGWEVDGKQIMQTVIKPV